MPSVCDTPQVTPPLARPPINSHMVVSVSSTPLCWRTALAQASGPSATYTSRHPFSGTPASSGGTSGGGGTYLAGAGPTAPGCLGPFTTCVWVCEREVGQRR
jgi:hypothetical protein